MEKFIVTLTKKDNKKVLVVCDTKEEAIAEGNELHKHISSDRGILSLIKAELDSDDKIKGGKYILYHSWL